MRPAAFAAPGARPILLAAAALGAATVAIEPAAGLVLAVGVPFLLLTSLPSKVTAYFAVLPLVWWLQVRMPGTSVRGVPDVIALAIALQLAWEFAMGRIRLPLRRRFVLACGFFALFVIVQAANPVIAATGAGFSGARVYLEPFVLFLAGLVVLGRPGAVERFFKVVVATALAVGAVMLRQLLFGFSGDEVAHQSESQIRTIAESKLFSTLPGPAVFGFVTAAFVVLCVLAFTAGIWPRLALVGAGTSAIGALASGVRMSAFALVVALALLALLLLRDPQARTVGVRLTVLGLAALMAVGTIVALTPVGERDDTFEAANALDAAVLKFALLKEGTGDEDVAGRMERLGLFVSYLAEHPGGAGPGLVSLVDAQTVRDPNTEVPPLPAHILREPWIFQHDFYYVALGVELGLVPLLLFLVLLLGGIGLAVASTWSHDDRRTRAVLDGAACVTLLALVYVFTNESFRTPQVAGYVWFLLAAPVALSRGSRTSAVRRG